MKQGRRPTTMVDNDHNMLCATYLGHNVADVAVGFEVSSLYKGLTQSGLTLDTERTVRGICLQIGSNSKLRHTR